MNRWMKKLTIGISLIAILAACRSEENIVWVTTDIVYAQNSWRLSFDKEEVFKEDVIKKVNKMDSSYPIEPYKEMKIPPSISSHDLIFSLRHTEDQVDNKEYLSLFKNYSDKYDSESNKKDTIIQMDKLENELNNIQTVIPSSKDELYFHGQICTLIDEIKWLREDYDDKEGEDEDYDSWKKYEIKNRLNGLRIISDTVVKHPESLKFESGGDFDSHMLTWIEHEESISENKRITIPDEAEDNTINAREPLNKDEALNKALTAVNERVQGYGEVIIYSGDLVYNGETYYAFDCRVLNEENYFTLFVNANDFKVYKDHQFETEWEASQ
ncbi:hypothetical protein ACQCVB_19810 [Fictibacillus phosphorivorans]|uniref:hypothetical protein n=1 Tax=Fictibacillus phosphorivorans TaxID=1221500 RepID=UPI003CF5A63A